MITSNNRKTISNTMFQGDWSFVPTAFSAVTGIAIGLMIGNYLGWL